MSAKSVAQDPGQSPGEVEQELRRLYDRAGAAYGKKDASSLVEMLTPDFQQQMPDGQVITRETAEAALHAWFKTSDSVTGYEIKLGAVSARGNDAIVTAEETVRSRFHAPDGVHERSQTNSARVTWTRTDSGWKIRRSDYVSAVLSVDGKPEKPFYTI